MNFSDRIQLWIDQLGGYLPNLLAAVLILVIGYFVAKFLQSMTYKLLRKTDLDNRLAGNTTGSVSPERSLSKLVYFIAMIFVLLAALSPLGLDGVLDPVRDMGGKFLNTIPGIVGAFLIGFVGYIAAKIVSGLVGMAAGFIEGVSQRAGLSTEINLTNILTTVVFILVFIPFLVAALDALGLEAITAPVSDMLSDFLSAIPRIFSAVLIIGAFYIGGKFITGLLQELLTNMGVNKLADRLSLSNMIGNNTDLAKLLANVAFFFIMFLGILTGVEQLGFERVNYMLSEIFELTGQIAFGMLILVIGNYLANLAYNTMSSGRTDTFMASIARVVILGLFLAIALRTMGIADDIVNLAFGLTLGAVAVAVALSFGLGGREAAGEQMRRILDKFNQDQPTTKKKPVAKDKPKLPPVG